MTRNTKFIFYIASLTAMITITFAFGRYIFSMISPDVANDLGLGYEFIGRINAAHQALYLSFSFLGGVFSKKLGAKTLINTSVFLCILSLISLTFVKNGWLILIIVGLQGIFAAVSWIPMVELMSRTIPGEIRGKCIGIVSGGTAYGLILNGFLIPIILQRANWQFVYLFFGLLSLFIGLMAIYFVKQVEYTENNVPKAERFDIPLDMNKTDIIHTIILYTMLVISGLYLIPYSSYLVAYMREDLNISTKVAGISWLILGFVGIFSGAAAGALADKLTAKKAMIITYSIVFVSVVVAAIAKGPILILLSCALYSSSFNGIFGLHPTYVSRTQPPEKTAKMFGIFNLSLGMGAMFGNYIFGFTKEAFGSFTFAYFCMSGLAFIALICCFMLRADNN